MKIVNKAVRVDLVARARLSHKDAAVDMVATRDFVRGGETQIVEGDMCVVYPCNDLIHGIEHVHVIATYHVAMMPRDLVPTFLSVRRPEPPTARQMFTVALALAAADYLDDSEGEGETPTLVDFALYLDALTNVPARKEG